MRHKRHERQADAEVDMTPLLDIVFIMLIFFIVTASFIRERGIEATRPDKSENQAESTVPPISLQIAENGEVWFKGRQIDPRAVRSNVARERATTPDAPVLIVANPKVDVAVSLLVMDQARAAGAVGVVLETSEP